MGTTPRAGLRLFSSGSSSRRSPGGLQKGRAHRRNRRLACQVVTSMQTPMPTREVVVMLQGHAIKVAAWLESLAVDGRTESPERISGSWPRLLRLDGPCCLGVASALHV